MNLPKDLEYGINDIIGTSSLILRFINSISNSSFVKIKIHLTKFFLKLTQKVAFNTKLTNFHASNYAKLSSIFMNSRKCSLLEGFSLREQFAILFNLLVLMQSCMRFLATSDLTKFLEFISVFNWFKHVIYNHRLIFLSK